MFESLAGAALGSAVGSIGGTVVGSLLSSGQRGQASAAAGKSKKYLDKLGKLGDELSGYAKWGIPLAEESAEMAKGYGTPEDLEAYGARNMADYITKLKGNRDTQRRNLMRMGINPESGRYTEATYGALPLDTLGMVDAYNRGYLNREDVALNRKNSALRNIAALEGLYSPVAGAYTGTSEGYGNMANMYNQQAAGTVAGATSLGSDIGALYGYGKAGGFNTANNASYPAYNTDELGRNYQYSNGIASYE